MVKMTVFKKNTPTLECLLECVVENLGVDVDRHYLENGYSQITFTGTCEAEMLAILTGLEIIENA